MARFGFAVSSALAALCLMPALASPALAEIRGSAQYIISLGGINIANVGFNLTDEGGAYSLDLDATVSGLGQMVASGTAHASSSGQSTATALISQNFDLTTRANGEAFSVRIGYAGGDATSFVVEPPLINNIDRVPIERSHLRKVGDMLSAFVFKGGSLDSSLCQRKMQIFTGVERFNLAFRFAADDVATSARTGYQGPVVLCNIRYTPVSGHFTSSEMTNFLAESDRILIWYAPVGTSGYFIPYRVLITTSVGDLSMVLTGMNF